MAYLFCCDIVSRFRAGLKLNIKMGKLFLLIILFTIPVFSYANIDPDTLISKSSLWKYLDNGTNQGTAWTLLSFNDSAWLSGFAELGYGDNDETTIIGYGPDPNNKYITTYFRQTFNISNASLYRGLRMNLKRDDGAIVYINGTEVYRSNMPSGPVTYTTLAKAAISGGAEKYFTLISLYNASILTGMNQIAVEVHQNAVTSSDISFDMDLIADTDAEVVRGPYLQMATPNSMTISWRTSMPEISKVLYGSTLSYVDSLSNPAVLTDHVIKINGLLPDTKYYYAINSKHETIQGDAGLYFITPPLPGSSKHVRIWTMGDMGTSNDQQNLVRDAYYNYIGNNYTNLIIFLGDNAYPTGTDEQYTTNIFTGHYEEILRKSVLYSTCGNHEYLSSTASNQTGPYYDIFTFPKNAEAGGVASGSEAYYSFNYANIHLICLESNIDSFGVANTNNMISWLHSDLSSNTLPWTIVYFHDPPYSMGFHNSDLDLDMTFMRQNIIPVLESYNVDLVLNGHSHDYERSYLLKGHYGMSSTFNASMIVNSGNGTLPNFYDKRSITDSGTVYTVVGCAGDLEQVSPGWPYPAMNKALDSVYGSMAIDINGDTLDAKFIDLNGVVADNFTIIKNALIGIDELDGNASQLNLFPNPARSELNIQFRQKINSELSIRIVNSLGETVKYSTEHGNSFLVNYNISNFSAGIYIVIVKNNNSIVEKRFVKE